MRAGALRGVILAALILLAAAPPPGEARAVSLAVETTIEPRFFRANESLETRLSLASDLPIAPGAVLKVELPAGAKPSAAPRPPAGWSLTAWRPDAARAWAELTATSPTSNVSSFAFPMASLSCQSGFVPHAWRTTLRTAANRAPPAIDVTHTCDKRAPLVASVPGHLVASTAEGSREIFLAFSDDSDAIVHNLTLARPDGTTFTISEPSGRYLVPLGPSAVGVWRYHAEAADAAGNTVRAPTTGDFFLNVSDGTLPILAIAPPGAVEAGEEFEIEFTATDNDGLDHVTLTYAIEGSAPVSRDVTGDGSATIPAPHDWQVPVLVTLAAVDRAGNANETTLVVMLQDTQPPGTRVTPEPDARWRGEPFAVTLDAEDAGSPRLVVDYVWLLERPDGSTSEVSGSGAPPLTLTISQDGEHSIDWSARDDAGNRGPTRSDAFHLDGTLPSVVFDGLADAWQAPPVTIRPWAIPLPSGTPQFTWSVDGEAIEDPAFVFEGPGVFDLGWQAVSAAGRTATGAATLRLDASAPSVTLSLHTTARAGSGDAYAGPVTARAIASDDQSGIEPVRYHVDADETGQTDEPTVTTEGLHVVTARARNGVGLVSEATRSFLIDLTAPDAQIFPMTHGDIVPAPARFRLDVQDATQTSAACRLDADAWDISEPVVEAGEHTLTCDVTDAVGWTTSSTVSFVVDADAPIIRARADIRALVAPLRDLRVSDTSPITLVKARYDDGPEIDAAHAGEDRWTLQGELDLMDGPHTLMASATDAQGFTTGWVEVAAFDLVTRPSLSGLSATPGAQPWRDDDLMISWSLPDGLAMLATLDGGSPTSVASPLRVGDSASLTLELVDGEGGRSFAETFEIRIDRARPEMSVILPERLVSNEPVSFSPPAREDAGSPVHRLAWVDGVALDPDARIMIEAEGAHVVAYRAVDEAGNLGPIHKSEITLDLTAPAMAEILPEQMLTNRSVSLAPAVRSDTGSAVHRLAWIDGIALAPNAMIVIGAEGVFRVTYRAADEAGNHGPLHETVIVLDATPPNITRLAPRATTRGSNVTVEFDIDPASKPTQVEVVARANGVETRHPARDGVADLGPLDAASVHVTLLAWDEAMNRAERTIEFPLALPASVGIPNHPPTLGSVNIRLDGAVARAQISGLDDADGDVVALVLSWLIDGRPELGTSVAVQPGAVVELRATAVDARGASTSVMTRIVVPPNSPPDAKLVASGIRTVGTPILFDASGSSDPEGGLLTFSWRFSDGAELVGARAEHAFLQEGDAWAVVTARDPHGATSDARADLRIDAAPAMPTYTAPDGATYTLPAPGSVERVVTSGPAPLILLQTSDGLRIWDATGLALAPVHERSAVLGNVSYAPRIAITAVHAPAAEGYVLARVLDPRPSLEFLGAYALDGAALPWWREGDTIAVLSNGGTFNLDHALAPLTLDASMKEADGAYELAGVAGGSGPLRSLRIEGPDGLIVDVTQRQVGARVAPGTSEATYLVIAETLAGERMERPLVVPAAPNDLLLQPAGGRAAEESSDVNAIVAGAPGPGTGMLLAGLAALAIVLRRRR